MFNIHQNKNNEQITLAQKKQKKIAQSQRMKRDALSVKAKKRVDLWRSQNLSQEISKTVKEGRNIQAHPDLHNFRVVSPLESRQNVYVRRYEPDLQRTKNHSFSETDGYDRKSPNHNMDWLRSYKLPKLGPNSFFFKYHTEQERFSETQKSNDELDLAPIAGAQIKYPAWKITDKAQWVNTTHFNNHVVPPRGMTKSVWGQVKEITEEPYIDGFENIGSKMRDRQKHKELRGPFLTGLNRNRVATSFDTSRSTDANTMTPLATPRSRIYKNSLDESINKLYLEQRRSHKCSIDSNN